MFEQACRCRVYRGARLFRRMAVLGLAVLVLAGCAASLARSPVPRELVREAEVVGLPDVRYWGDELPPNYEAIAADRMYQIRDTRPELVRRGATPMVNHLAISGGADEGAFGAGLLVGWSVAGTRPQFEIVTGVSTGAIIAPFAFLGSAYDDQLREVFTTYETDQLASLQILSGVLGGTAVADNSQLAALIARYVTSDMLRAIAREHGRGRRLLVGTTNLDAQRPVIWDMGAIATRGGRKALDLFRRVILASAAIPGVFPPVQIRVTAGGMVHDELHVDGGTTAQVFFLPTQLSLARLDAELGLKPRRRLYVIRNVKTAPEWEAVKPRLTSIAGRSLSTLMKNQAIGDLYRLYLMSQRNKMDFKLAAVPPEFVAESDQPFDPAYMQALFAVGYQAGIDGRIWKNAPPGVVAAQPD